MNVPRPAWRTESGELIDGDEELRDLPDIARKQRPGDYPGADEWPTWIGLSSYST